MTTNHDRCPAGHTFIGPDSDLRRVWLAAHGAHERRVEVGQHVLIRADGEIPIVATITSAEMVDGTFVATAEPYQSRFTRYDETDGEG